MTKMLVLSRSRLEGSIFIKVTSFFLILSFIFGSPSFVYGQEVGTASGSIENNASQAQPVVEIIPDKSVNVENSSEGAQNMENELEGDFVNNDPVESNVNPETEEGKVKEIENLNEKEIGEPNMELLMGDPEGPSNANASFTSQSIQPKVDKTSGSLVQSFSIVVPKGRNGLHPDLAIIYNSQNLEEGVVGYGWSINIPYIERINRRGTNNLYTDNYFNSSISGELASTTTFNQYKAKVEEPGDLSYVFSTTTNTGGSWVAYDKNGTKYSFGTSTSARQEDDSDSSKVYRWMIQEIRDTNNNYIRFEYYKDSGQIYPSKIYYTGNGSVDGIFEIEFIREGKSDVVTSYRTAFLVQTNYRISQIQAKINGTWVRKYDLDYTTGSNGYRSLLSTITESGQDESGSGSISLPVVTFEYNNTPVTFSSFSGGYPGSVNGSFVVLSDTDGNGLLDRNISYLNSVSGNNYNLIELNFNEGYTSTYNTSYYYNQNWSRQTATSYVPNEIGTRYFDLNGDGFADVIRSHTINGGSNTKKIYLNDGNYASTSSLGWTESFLGTTSLPYFAHDDGSSHYSTLGIFGNLNGDGLVDFTSSNSAIINPHGGYFGNGISFDYSTTTIFGGRVYIPAYGTSDLYASQLIDINNDGLDDWVYNNGNTIDFCLNTGLVWQSSCNNGFKIASTTVDSNGHDRGIRFADINGDGLPDFIRSYNMPTYTSIVDGSLPPPQVESSNIVLLNTGSGWATSTIAIPVTITQHIVGVGGSYNSSVSPSLVEMWDWTGDGLAEFSGYKNSSNKPDILKKIVYSSGGSTSVSYQPTTQQMRSNKAKHVNLPMSIHVVNSIVNYDANGNYSTTTYSYENGDLYFNNGYDRKFAGFENIIETTEEAITKTYFYQGNIASTTVGELTDDVSRIGKVYREDILATTTGNLIKRNFYNWDSFSKSTNRYFIALTRTVEQIYDGNSTHRDKASTFLYNTDTGTLTQKIDYGEVSGSTDGTFSDIGSDLASTTITYSASTTINMFLPSVEITQNQSLLKIKEKKYYYDSLSSGSINVGNLTKKELWKEGSSYASTTKTYNAYGLVTQEKDSRGNSTDYTYDTYNLYVATSTNALSHNTNYTYDYSSGKVKQTINPNGRIFQNFYDGFDRITETKQPDLSTPTSLVTKTQYVYTDNVLPTKIQEINNLNSATSTNKYAYFDGFGRKIQERVEAEGDNTYSVRDFVYGANSRILKESLPYFASSTTWSSATTTNQLFNFYNYDGLGRVLSISNSVGTTTNVYDDWRITTTDPMGKLKDFYSDAYSNLVNVVEHNIGVSATTTYAYDLNQNLVSIIDGVGNIRNFTYDGLNRRLTAEDLHASGDGTYGVYTYTYDDVGNITQKIDPKSQTINYTYDSLNRPLTEDYAGSAGTEVTYTYDTGVDSKGKLIIASSTDARITNSYNPLGGIKFSTTTISGIDYTTEYDYDRLGNYNYITYPDGSKVRYWYNSAGLLESVTQRENGESYNTLISNFDYAPTGKVSVKDFGNGVQTLYTYDPNTLYRLVNIVTISGGLGGSLEDMLLHSSSTNDIVYDSSTTTEGVFNEVEIYPVSTSDVSTTTDIKTEDLIGEVLATTSEMIIEGDTDLATSTEIESEIQIEDIQVMDIKKEQSLEVTSQSNLVGAGFLKALFFKDKPRIVLEKWNGEVSLGISYNGIPSNTKGEEVETKQIEWGYGGEKLEAIVLEPTDGMEDGGVKINIILNSKPSNNIFNFQIDGYEDLDFLYQEPLWKEEGLKAPISECSDTDCIKSNGRHYFRPENIVGSFAVYYKNKNGYKEGEMNYATGKAFHIYRPLILDSNGGRVWGEMRYVDGELSVIVPQDFLDNAAYPVTVDPTFGYTSVGASTNDFGGNVLYAKSNSTPASNGSLTSMSIYGKIFTSTPDFNPALYSNSSNAPSTRLAHIDSGGTSYGSSPAWVTTNIGYSGITSGTQYWLGFKSSAVGPLVNYDSGGSGTLHYGYGSDWNSTADDAGNENGIYSIYSTYTASSTPSSPTLLQNISYTYDANGNITQISDTSDTGVAKTVLYTYDDLNRLTIASTTSATSTPYRYQWVYDVLGNITTQNDGISTSTYSYAGNTGSLYANPHAVTSIVAETATGGISTSTPAFIQSKKDSSNSSVTFNSDVSNGNLVVVGLTSYEDTLTSNAISDNKGNTYTRIMEVVNYDTNDHGAIYYAKNVTGGSSFTVTSSVPGTLTIHEYSGVSIYSPLDKTASSTGSSAIPFSGDVTTNIGNELYFGLAWNQSNGVAWNAGYGYTLRENETNNATLERIATEDKVITSATTTPAFFVTGDDPWLAAIATFKPATTTSSGGSISTTTVTYDNNGNILTDGTNTYIWDYKNNLTQIGNSTATSTYSYDHTGQRVKVSTPSGTTFYPNKYYNISTTTTTKSVFANGELISTIIGTSTSANLKYVHNDHLGSTNVVTDSIGEVVQALDYYPYGTKRVQSGADLSQREYIGEQFDEESNLSYLNARYYDGNKGKFISQDPVFWEIGITQDGKKALQDPQLQNSYSYASNNPIINKDPNGRQSATMVLGGGGASISSLAYIGPVGWGVGVFAASFAAGYYGTQYVLNNSQKWIETVQPTNYAELLHPQSSQFPKPDDLQPPRGNGPEWQKWLYFGLGTGAVGYGVHEAYEKFKDDVSGYLKNIFGGQNNSNKSSGTGINISQQYVVQGSSTYMRSSTGSLTPTNLPAIVNDGQGNTFYRNSSGLLSAKPGQ